MCKESFFILTFQVSIAHYIYRYIIAKQRDLLCNTKYYTKPILFSLMCFL